MGLKHSIPLSEPQRGKDLLLKANEQFVGSETLVKFAPVLADGLVFTYPVLLLVMYLMGVYGEHDEMRVGALYIFLSAGFTAFFNIGVQYLIDKERPEGYIGNADMLIMDHLPTAPFPSDHAAVSMAVGMATLLWAWKNGYTTLSYIGGFLVLGSLIMSWSRVGVGIHWPTDVIVGTIVGILVAVLLHGFLAQEGVVRSFVMWLIGLQELIFSKIGLNG